MKIGIITYWDSQDNYGQVLQCYALQRYLKDLGHNPYLIRFKESPANTSGFKLSKIPTYICNLKSYLKYLSQRRKNHQYAERNQLCLRDFDGFRREHIIASEDIYSEKSIMQNPPEGDAFICGSDQIWGGSLIYYLPFVPKNKIKIAYAPSFGGTNPFLTPDSDKISSCLSDFDFIGIRESSGAKLLNEHGFNNAIQVVDPTLLLEADVYTEFFEKNQAAANDIFIYLLGNQIDCSIDSIIKFVQSKKQSYTYVASQGRVDKYTKIQATVPQWINHIAHSKVVITNSFHCVVFALTFHKPFIFIPLGGSYARMNDRLDDLLTNVELKSQIYRGNFESIPLNPDFSKFDSFKKSQIQKTTEIFRSLFD